MAIPSSALLLGVAELLIKRWKPELKGNLSGLIPNDLELAEGLRRLLVEQDDLQTIFDGISDPKKVKLDLLEAGIKALQQSLGGLKVDGILGTKGLSTLFSSLACIKTLPQSTTKLNDAFKKMVEEKGGDPKNDENWYFYYVEELPPVPGPDSADILVESAWGLWQDYADVKVERLLPKFKDAANVIIKTADLPSSVLGRANVGAPPGGYVLEIEMDITRNWDPVMFEGAVAHEIGHVLGLEHQPVPGLLMSERVRPDWRDNFDKDGMRAAALKWLGPAPEIEREEKREGDFEHLRFKRRRRHS